MTDTQISQAHSIVGHSRGRPDTDFYSTPEFATVALLEREEFKGSIWEPACGKGAISEVLERELNTYVVSTDLYDYGYSPTKGEFAERDFLDVDFLVSNIITNPPYKLAQEFVEHALECTHRKVAMLLKLVFLESAKRYELFQRSPLKTVYVFSKRLCMYRNDELEGKSSMICFAWFVWEHGYDGKPYIEWIL